MMSTHYVEAMSGDLVDGMWWRLSGTLQYEPRSRNYEGENSVADIKVLEFRLCGIPLDPAVGEAVLKDAEKHRALNAYFQDRLDWQEPDPPDTP